MILKALYTGEGYIHHPATKMWQGHELALTAYGLTICNEWMDRGYKDNQHEIMLDYWPFSKPQEIMLTAVQLKARKQLPWWFGWSTFHESHRSNLLRKDPHHYEFRFMGPDSTASLPYVWPSPEFGKYKKQHSKDSIYYSAPPPKRRDRA